MCSVDQEIRSCVGDIKQACLAPVIATNDTRGRGWQSSSEAQSIRSGTAVRLSAEEEHNRELEPLRGVAAVMTLTVSRRRVRNASLLPFSHVRTKCGTASCAEGRGEAGRT